MALYKLIIIILLFVNLKRKIYWLFAVTFFLWLNKLEIKLHKSVCSDCGLACYPSTYVTE